MTNQQAISLLKGLEQSLDDYCELNDEGKAAFCMAVTALELFGNSEQLQSAQLGEYTGKRTKTHACDSISRQKAIRWVKTECNPYGKPTIDFKSGKKVIEHLENMPSAQSEQQWIPVTERLPACEQEVLICTKKKVYISKNSGLEWHEEPIITPAMYEDGTMLEVNSKWIWEDIDYAGWDEEEDCGIIPEGWWENRHFNPDEVYNNPVDKEVMAWMPLPKPYGGD